MNKAPVNYIDFIRKYMLELPGVTEGICFATTAFYVRKKLLVRMKEDNVTLMVHTPDRDEWTIKDAATFFITDHYKNYPSVLVNLVSVKKKDLSNILFDAWKSRAGIKLIQLQEKK